MDIPQKHIDLAKFILKWCGVISAIVGAFAAIITLISQFEAMKTEVEGNKILIQQQQLTLSSQKKAARYYWGKDYTNYVNGIKNVNTNPISPSL